MIILFPCDPLNLKQPDLDYAAEFNSVNLLSNFKTFVFDHDEFVRTGNFKSNLTIVEGQNKIILRSWMLKKEQYIQLYDILLLRGFLLINTPEQYLNCHYFPNVYQYIAEHTTKSWWSGPWHIREEADSPENIEWSPVRNLLGNNDLIIKDYVKSAKGEPDLFILSKELSNEEFGNRIKRFIEARGKLFNEGIVFKQVEKLKLYETQTNEYRFFFIQKKMFIFDNNSTSLNKNFAEPSRAIIEVLNQICEVINSNFFTIDIAEKENGDWMILECGDGQVSGLASNADPIVFWNKLNNSLKNIEQ